MSGFIIIALVPLSPPPKSVARLPASVSHLTGAD